MCVSHVAQYICEMARQPGFKLSFPTKPEWSFEAKLLANAIMYANERVFIQSCKDRSMEGMGTTVTAIFNAPHGLVLAHVGDSRIYRVRKGEITQMTRDHSSSSSTETHTTVTLSFPPALSASPMSDEHASSSVCASAIVLQIIESDTKSLRPSEHII